MTISSFVTRSAFRNRRRSILTALSITFSILLLTLMMTIWRRFYIDQAGAQNAQRLVVRHRVSLAQPLPAYYREKIRSVPGVVAVAPSNWFGGQYKDEKAENTFAQFGTDPAEIFQIWSDYKMPADQLAVWQRDRAGVVVDSELARKYRWKIGDRIVLKGTFYPVDLELTIRGIFVADPPSGTVIFSQKYVEEAVPFARGQAQLFDILVDSPASVSRVSAAVDAMFHNSPAPAKTESEKAFELDYISTLGNVKAFILSISFAVAFATLLVSANTMAMSIRERTREVAVMKAIGYTRQAILAFFVCEGILVALVGGLLGCGLATGLVTALAHAPGMVFFFLGVKVTLSTFLLGMFTAACVGFLSAVIPAYHAAKLNIVEGLRYLG